MALWARPGPETDDVFGEPEAPPALWGIGRVHGESGPRPWPVSAADVEDEAASLAPRLAALGLDERGLVLIVSLLSETIHVAPLEQAAGRLGALYSSADATPFDAFRTASLVRQLRPTVVIGVTSRVLDGLTDDGHDLAQVFGAVPALVAADAEGVTRLAAAGLAPLRWAKLGPTSAIQAPGDPALAYDATRWQVDEAADGELLVTNLVPRLTHAHRLPTGARGSVLHPGRVLLTS